MYFQSQPGEIEEAVEYAINIGYRHIDCAWFYGNEKEIGKVIQDKIKDDTVKREDLFIVTKVLKKCFDASQLSVFRVYFYSLTKLKTKV